MATIERYHNPRSHVRGRQGPWRYLIKADNHPAIGPAGVWRYSLESALRLLDYCDPVRAKELREALESAGL